MVKKDVRAIAGPMFVKTLEGTGVSDHMTLGRWGIESRNDDDDEEGRTRKKAGINDA